MIAHQLIDDNKHRKQYKKQSGVEQQWIILIKFQQIDQIVSVEYRLVHAGFLFLF